MRRTLFLLLAVGLSLLLAAPARAALGDRLLSDFADDGAIDACKYSEGDLGQIKNLIANDIDAYEPDFRTAVDAMIERRAQGACSHTARSAGSAAGTAAGAGGGSSGTSAGGGSGGGAGSPSGAGGASGTGGAPPAVPGPNQIPTPSPLIATDSVAKAARAHDQGGTLPVALLAIAVLIALMVLGGLILATARWLGWTPSWASRSRHAAGEAGVRASSTWSDFTDFVRLGR